MTTKVNRQWCLATRPVGAIAKRGLRPIAESNFEWKQEPVPSLEGVCLATGKFWSVRKFKALKALYIKDFNFRNQTLLQSLNIQDEHFELVSHF
jgi:hypothetical protein